MALEQVSAKLTASEPVTAEYDFGDDLKGCVDKFGEDVVFSNAKAALVINLQAYMRTQIKAGKATDEIQQMASTWVPGIKAKGRTAAERVRDLFGRLSTEDRAALLEEFGIPSEE